MATPTTNSRAASQRRWEEANPEKVAAHRLVKQALDDGRLVRQPCEVCGAAKVHAHHDDYSKPLEVRWLCPTHHATEEPPLEIPDVAREIRHRRAMIGATQVQLAASADVSLCTLQNFERGAIPKRSRALPAILAALSAAEVEQGALTTA